MYKKFVASFMTALMAAMTLVSPALGATALNTYPTFLGKVGDFYVVVGKDAAASDVAGAIDIASNLAQLSYKDTTVSGTTSSGLTGTERKIIISSDSTGSQVGGTGSNNLPSTLRNFHYTGLKDGQFEYKGVKYNYHDEVRPSSPTASALTLTHSLSDPINGTLKMKMDSNGIEYRYVFDSAIPAGNIPTSANSSSYSQPLKITVAGRQFQIVAIASATSFVSLVGTVATLSDGESLTAGDLTFTVKQSFASSTAKIEATDASGNVVKSSINTGSTESFTYGGATYSYKVLSSGATASGVSGYAQLLAGKGDIEKTFDGGTESTVSEWGSDWKIGASLATTGGTASGNYISVVYAPASLTNAQRYLPAGTVFKGPGGFFELKYAGYTPDKFAKVTIEDSATVTLYDVTAATGYNTTGNLRGLKITSDVAGTIVNSSTGYDEVYVLFSNATGNANSQGASYYYLAYKDKTTSRVVAFSPVYYTGVNINASNTNGTINSSWAFTLSYGGPGATQQFQINSTLFNNRTLLNGVTVYNLTSGGLPSVVQVNMSFMNRSTGSTTTAPELVLGTGVSTADASDVTAAVESASQTNVGDQVGDLISDGGVQVYSIKSNTQGNKVVIGIPPEIVYGLVQFGKIGEAVATTGGTVKEVVAVTAAVAKLDNEVSATDKTGKNLVLVGGPCKNSLVADLKTAGKFAYGCADWPGRNFAIVQAVDSPFSTGGTNKAVVVAGTRAEDTRLASSVLQAYATKLSAITGSKVEVTGTALATATVTAA